MFTVCETRRLSDTITQMTVEAPAIARKVKAGQFVILRIDEPGERIPLTVAMADPDAGTVTLIFQAVGATTRQLATLRPGDALLDLVGPLGCPTEYGSPKKAIVIGGGVGCAIAYPQARALTALGVDVTVIAGFRSKELVILESELRDVSRTLYITTDDGSYGEHGFVTDVLKRLLTGGGYDLVIAIGPVPMMKFVSLTTKPFGVRTIVSLNPIMIDGTGMCGGCRVTVGGETKFACVDGPDFDGHLVDYDGLMRRNGVYRAEEQEHLCRWEAKLRG